MGAYLSTAAPGIPDHPARPDALGPVPVPAVKEDVYGVYTNTTPVEAYRGAGRPEATFMLERMIDRLAHKLSLDPVDVRRRNLLPPFDNGHDVVTGLTYDSGNYAGASTRRSTRRLPGSCGPNRHGCASRAATSASASRPTSRSAASAPRRWQARSASRADCGRAPSSASIPTGKVNVFIGASPHGQGEETTFAQIVADEVGVDVERREGRARRHRHYADGLGHLRQPDDRRRRRSARHGRPQDQGQGEALAAHLLEAALEDIDYEAGRFFVKGSPDRRKTIQDIALIANVAWNLPPGMEAGLEASAFYDPPNFMYPFGAHVAVVEVDRDTGGVGCDGTSRWTIAGRRSTR